MEHTHRRDILFFFAVAIAVALAYSARQVLLLIYVSVIFAVVLSPFVDLIQRISIGRWHPNRGVAAILLLLVIFGAIALFFTFAIPPIFSDAKALADDWPHKMATLKQKISALPYGDRFNPASLSQYAGGAAGGAFNVAKNVAQGVFGFFSGLVLMIYFILDGGRAFHWFLSLFEPTARARLERTMVRADLKVRNWLIGQATLMLILGVLATIAFSLMGLRYSYALGVLTGLANIIPIIGPVVSVTLACIVALVDSPVKVLFVLGFYVAYQQLETAFLTPKVMKASVDLPALAIIVALSLGGTLAGVLGALMAVPTAAIVSVFIDEYLVKRPADPAQQVL